MLGDRVPAHLIFKYFGGKDMYSDGSPNIYQEIKKREEFDRLIEENKKLKEEIVMLETLLDEKN